METQEHKTNGKEITEDMAAQLVDNSTLAALNKSEIESQVATAKRYPRSVTNFVKEAVGMVQLSEDVAEECIYALPRAGEIIKGPSARLAEIVANAWGNCRAGARVVAEEEEFVVAQGVFHDLQKNVAITYEVKRRIVDRNGKRYKPDMVGVTANAACSIALRNAVLKGVPKALWMPAYEAAERVIKGDEKSLDQRRKAALDFLKKTYKVEASQIFARLGVNGEQDITLDHLVTLRGILTALKEGDTTVEQAFAVEGQPGVVEREPAQPVTNGKQYTVKYHRGDESVEIHLPNDLVKTLLTHVLFDQCKAEWSNKKKAWLIPSAGNDLEKVLADCEKKGIKVEELA